MKQHSLLAMFLLLSSLIFSSCGGGTFSSSPVLASSANVSSSSSNPASSSAASSSSSLSSSSFTLTTDKIQVDGVGALAAVEALGYQQPVWGVDLASRYLGQTIDDFSPTLTCDNAGLIKTDLSYVYDAKHTWHCENLYSNVGTTVVPTAYLDNIIFDEPTSTNNGALPLDASTTTYAIQWAENHTIASSGSTVVAGVVTDMSNQISGILVNGTTLRTDWTLAPRNAAYASASEKSFTIIKAANRVQINLCLDGAALNGIYFTVNAISAEVDAMNNSIATTPFAQNYTAELVNTSTKEVLLTTTHNPHYFMIDDQVKKTKSGVFDCGVAVDFDLVDQTVLPKNYRAYPLKENRCGVVCPFDTNPDAIVDFLNNTSSLTVPYIIKVALGDLIASLPNDLLGVSLADYLPDANAGNFIGVSFDEPSGTFTLALLIKTVSETTTTYADSGYAIRLSKRGTSQVDEVDRYLQIEPILTFEKVPEMIVNGFASLSSKKNYTVVSHSYWEEDGVKMEKGADLLALENATLLKSTDSTAFVDASSYFAEDKNRRNYRGCISVNHHLYSITGVPDYARGGVIWGKKDVTSYTDSNGVDQTSEDLWNNPNVVPYFTLADCTVTALRSLNVRAHE